MSLADSGPAIVLVYGGGTLETALLHAQDGGRAYMAPLVRKAVQYAKTHYDSGDIARVLESEGEMRRMDLGVDMSVYAPPAGVRHVYYVMYRWDPEACRKTYRVRALHLEGRCAGAAEIPARADMIPTEASPL